MSHQKEIRITEEFDDDQGRFVHYDAYDDTLRAIVGAQKHRDIRTFTNTPGYITMTLADLDGRTMDELDGIPVEDLDDMLVIPDENWFSSSGVDFGPDSSRNYWNTLRASLQDGEINYYRSQLPDWPVDMESDFDDDDFISCAFPGLPLSRIDASQSFIYFTSEDDAGFLDSDQQAFVAFDTSNPVLVNGNSEGRWTRGSLTKGDSFDLSNITGVDFRIVTQGSGAIGTFKAAGLRLLNKDWKYLPVDFDTRHKVLKRTVSRDGLTTAPYDADLPIIWRADDPSSSADPRPVDAKIAVTFFTGTTVTSNQFSIYMRENNKDFMTQLDLNGMTQAALNGQPQPDIGEAKWLSRPQTDLERYTQDELDAETQFTLERTADALSSSYIEFSFQWSDTTSTLTLRNSEGNGYTFTVPGITDNAHYIVITELEGTAARAVIYPIDAAGNIDTGNRVYDTFWIDDDFTFKRQQGRIGWATQLSSGDAFIDGIRTRGVVFAEQRTHPFDSITPVDGAQLFAEFSPDRQLVVGADERKDSTITFDSGTTLGESYKVAVTGTGQGIHTNLIAFENFDETDVSFNVYLPKTAVNAGATLRTFLTNDLGREISLNLGPIIPDQWNEKRLPLNTLGDKIQTGLYRFAIVNNSSEPFTFWVAKPISITERTVAWSGRSVVDDPWKSNDAKWVNFRDQVNLQNGGVTFYQRGNQVQIRGQALRQTAHIGKAKIQPRYAQLGRLIFEERPSVPALTSSVAVVVTPVSGRTVDFSITGTNNNRIVLYQWSFGDGTTDFGRVVRHTYDQGGTYPISLTVTDVYGQRVIATGSAVV